MSYVLVPAGVSNPMTADLDADQANILDVDKITVSVIDPAVASSGVTIGDTTADKIGFYGANAIDQEAAMPAIILPPLPPTYDATGVQASLDVLKARIENVNSVLSNLGLRSA